MTFQFKPSEWAQEKCPCNIFGLTCLPIDDESQRVLYEINSSFFKLLNSPLSGLKWFSCEMRMEVWNRRSTHNTLLKNGRDEGISDSKNWEVFLPRLSRWDYSSHCIQFAWDLGRLHKGWSKLYIFPRNCLIHASGCRDANFLLCPRATMVRKRYRLCRFYEVCIDRENDRWTGTWSRF